MKEHLLYIKRKEKIFYPIGVARGGAKGDILQNSIKKRKT